MLSFESGKKSAGKLLALLRRWAVSEWSMLFETILAAVFFLTNAEVAGVVTFVYIIAAKLILSDDSLGTFLPFLLIGLIVLRLYDSFDTFMSLKFVMGVPAVVGVLFHFFFYRVKPQKGALSKGYLALSFALALGGLFSLPAAHYFSGTSAYYVLGLGFGMLALYSALYRKLDPRNEYDIKEHVAWISFYAAAFSVFIIAVQYLGNLSEISKGWEFSLTKLSSLGNNLCTTVLMTSPFCFYLSGKKGFRGALAFLVGVLSAFAAVFSLSRGGLLFVPATVLFYALFALVRYKSVRKRNAILLFIVLAAFLAIFFIWKNDFKKLFAEGFVPSSLKVRLALIGAAVLTFVLTAYAYYLFRMKNAKKRRVHFLCLGGLFLLCFAFFLAFWDKIKVLAVEVDSYRGNMMIIAARNFKTFPFFGTGIGYRGLRGVYENKQGMFGCYHCLPVQIVGSMGLFGAAAYAFMLKERLTALSKAPDGEYASIVLFSYLGLLFMSLVNPGIFCPVVYGLQLAIYFISAERSGENADKPPKSSAEAGK